MSEYLLQVKDLKKYFTTKGGFLSGPKRVVKAVDGVSFQLEEGEIFGIVGESGCGKSTLGRTILRLVEADSGEILFDGTDIRTLSREEMRLMRQKMQMIFQDPGASLNPRMTVGELIQEPLELFQPQLKGQEQLDHIYRLMDMVGIDRTYFSRFPHEFSGGQRQRVALGRAIVRSPQVFLLDEPLSNLDAKLRAQMRTEIAKLHQKLGTTFIYVTHDQTEAMTMGDRIVVMKDGIIQQVDTPQALYEHPCNKFVAGFLGSPQMNFIDAVLKKNGSKYVVEFGSSVKYTVEIPESKVAPQLDNYVGKEVTLGIRPESVHDEEMYLSNATTGVIDCDVDITEMMGAETYLYLTCEGTQLTARVSPRSTAKAHDKIKVAIDPNRIHLFDKENDTTIIN